MRTNYKYKAFISYSHSDQETAKRLHLELESYRVPKRLIGTNTHMEAVPARLTPIFRDQDDLASSPDLSERILDVLANSENLIVVCSPNAAKSRWVNQEIEAFKEMGRSNRIFCLIVDGDPVAKDTPRDCFPPALRIRYDTDGIVVPGHAEPIAADIRNSGDGHTLAKLKIIAGLINVGLDDLRQRELQRRHRRLLVITGSSIAATAFTLVLALNAMFARDEAELARAEADQRREQAEDLLSFMVGDLRSNLAPMGRLDLLETVGARAMDYFGTVNVDNLTDDELLRQAEVLTHIGEIRMDQLNYEDALASFSEAYERSAALQLLDPSDGDRLFLRGQTEFWIGSVHWANDSFHKAQNWWTRYRNTSLELVSLDSERTEWKQEVAYSYHNLAVLAEDQGDMESAREGFQYMLSTLEELQQEDENTSHEIEIADATSWLGNIALNKGELTSALTFYQRSMDQLYSLWEKDKANTIVQDHLAAAISRMSTINAMIGELDTSSQLADEAISLFEALIAIDESNVEWKLIRVVPLLAKAQVLFSQGEWQGAQQATEKAIASLEELDRSEAMDLNIFSYLANAYLTKAWIEQAQANFEGALMLSRIALENMHRIGQIDSTVDERFFVLASVHVLQAELYSELGDEANLQAVLGQTEKLLQDKIVGISSPYLLDPWARLLFHSDRVAEAMEIIDALNSSHYQPLRPWPI